jgi:ribosomal protein L40E
MLTPFWIRRLYIRVEDQETFHQSCGNVVGSLSTLVVVSLSSYMIIIKVCRKCEHEVWIDPIQPELGTTNAIFEVCRKCEHEVWIDPIQPELGTTNAIFICVPEIK